MSAFSHLFGAAGGTATKVQLSSSVLLADDAVLVNFTSIDASYRHLFLEITARGDTNAAVDSLVIQLNGDTTVSNYHTQIHQVLNAAHSNVEIANDGHVGTFPAATADANSWGYMEVLIPNYTKTHLRIAIGQTYSIDSATSLRMRSSIVHWTSTAAVTTVAFVCDSAENFLANSEAVLYGLL